MHLHKAESLIVEGYSQGQDVQPSLSIVSMCACVVGPSLPGGQYGCGVGVQVCAEATH